MGIALGEFRHRHRNDLFITSGVILHLEHADRTHVDHRAWHNRSRVGDEYVYWIAILRKCVWHEPVITGITHRGVQEAIDHQRSRSLVHFIFDRLTAYRYLDYDIHIAGRIVTDCD